MFIARVVEHGVWRTLAEPQRQPGNACFLLAAYIVREDPSAQLERDQVYDAVRRPKGGEFKVAIGDYPHIVYRTDLSIDVQLRRLGEPLLWFM